MSKKKYDDWKGLSKKRQLEIVRMATLAIKVSERGYLDSHFEESEVDWGVTYMVASVMKLKKQKGEKDTEFVKRIVLAYKNAEFMLQQAERGL